MPTRILLVGGGGREHALAWRLAGEPGVNLVVVAPGSDAIAGEPRVRCASDVDPLDGTGLVALARAESVELAVIGPEAPLAAGVADELIAAGIPTFGPTRAAARIETSKGFCHEVAEAAGVPMARARTFSDSDARAAHEYASELAAGGAGLVVKADGLAAGKGVTVCDVEADAHAAIDELIGAAARGRGSQDDGRAMPGASPARLVIEERLHGREASLIALCDGRDAIALPPVRDHKRLGDGDTGPNTGGMGAYSPVPDLPDADAADLVERIHRPLLAELARRGTPFRGTLYAGLMLTDAGPMLLECNARFGDPETQAIMPRLTTPLGPLLLAAARGRLADALRPFGLAVPLLPATGAAVVIVAAAAGYPASPRRGDGIEGLAGAASLGALVFHAGTRRDPDGTYRTAGGRVLSVVGRGPDLPTARSAAERAMRDVTFAGMQRRTDIGATTWAGTGDGPASEDPAVPPSPRPGVRAR